MTGARINMGCNSHLAIEVRPYKHSPEHWYLWGKDLAECRWYWLYGKMAGVRGDDSPVVEPRGFPEDVSPDFNDDWGNDSGYHTPTWLKPSEFFKCLDGAEGGIPWEWAAIFSLLKSLQTDLGDDNVRLIVAFDN